MKNLNKRIEHLESRVLADRESGVAKMLIDAGLNPDDLGTLKQNLNMLDFYIRNEMFPEKGRRP